MNTLQDHKVNVKLKLATLWVSFIFLYSYVDYLHLYMPGSIKSILEGKIFIFDISYSFLLVVMCLVTIPTSIYQYDKSAFDENLSVNYIVKKDKHRVERIKVLMDYSFDMCRRYGEVYLSEDENACALVLFPDLKKDNLWTISK
nr:hypothetical protein [uncultured Pedobacter sp.]